MCPLAATISLSTVAARALLIALRLSLSLILCEKSRGTGGNARRPPTVPGANAPTKFICIPRLVIVLRGILESPFPYAPL